MNFNVVKSGCLIIEVLEGVKSKFEQLGVRCQTLRGKVEIIVKRYMHEVETE